MPSSQTSADGPMAPSQVPHTPPASSPCPPTHVCWPARQMPLPIFDASPGKHARTSPGTHAVPPPTPERSMPPPPVGPADEPPEPEMKPPPCTEESAAEHATMDAATPSAKAKGTKRTG